MVDELFPLAEINAAGYHCIFAGQKTYNGVALLMPCARHTNSKKFAYKLEWLSHLKTLVAESLKTYPHLILLGDFNIAPRDEDVCDPEVYRDGILTHETVRDSLQVLYDLGMQDVFQFRNRNEKPPYLLQDKGVKY